MKKEIFSLFVAILMAQMAFAQGNSVSGVVVDKGGEPVTGVVVREDGTKNAAITDINGTFSLAGAQRGAILSFSYVGMQTKQAKASPDMRVVMEDDQTNLNEVVVIGYGSAKAKDLTSPIVVVKGSELTSTPSTSPLTALQGKVAGVNITNTGAPGSAPIVRIRGVGSYTSLTTSNSDPLYVVDGMLMKDISFLDNNDIQDMSVLKDASAAAIYGVKAANGVIIITTKKGVKNQPARITYDGYVGAQNATNVLSMASSNQYSTMLMEANPDAYAGVIKGSIDRYGGSYAASDFHDWTFGANTNWYKELLRSAITTSHSVGITGGGDRASYSFGGTYIHEDGIMDVDNNYDRFNLRAAVDYDATSWLKVGFNGVFSRSNQVLPNNTAWQAAFNAPGLFPVMDSNANTRPVKYASPSDIGFDHNIYNPVAVANYFDSTNDTRQFLANMYAQVNIIPEKLSVRTSINYNYQQIAGLVYAPVYYVSADQGAGHRNDVSTLQKTTTTEDDYVWDNTVTYKDRWGLHDFGAMVGMSMRQQSMRLLQIGATNVPGGKEEYLYTHNGSLNTDTNITKDDGSTDRGLSYFTRLNYDYNHKYYLMFTLRADGSSKYQEKWGYFPSVGVSWVMSEEPWMKNQGVIDYFKIRGSWGKLGNDAVSPSDGFASVTYGNGVSGVFGNGIVPGLQDNSLFTYMKWEVTTELNFGFTMNLLRNRLSIDADYFHRVTDNVQIPVIQPFSSLTLLRNAGQFLNEGADVSLTWNDKIGKDFKYNVGVNLSFLRNKVLDIYGQPYVTNGKTYNIKGEEINSYYGYKVVGVYQNDHEVASDPIAVANNLKPGDFKYQDVNDDDIIDGHDLQTLGSYIPNFTYGINLGFAWKNIDLNLTTYGQMGAQMYNRERALRTASAYYNFDKAQYNDRWTGDGSTNSNPSAAGLMNGWNVSDTKVNSYFVESANYFRVQNVTLGYTFRNIALGSYKMPSVRLSLTADRPLMLFSAHAFTPELSDLNGWNTEVYPLTSTYTFGVQIQF